MENEVVQPNQVKEVNFQGDTLLAINQLDKTYVAVRLVAEALGLTKGQMQSERLKINNDIVLSQGKRNFVLPTNGGTQEFLCIELDYLPLWLAKISITPKMKTNSPEIVNKLIDYQLKAKDVLAQAFIRPKTSAELVLAQAHLLVEAERRLTNLEENQRAHHHQLSSMIGMMSETPERARIVRKIRELSRHQNTSIRDTWREAYDILYDKYGIDVKRRIQNKRNRINQERAAEGKRPYSESTLKQKTNALDVIMDEGLGREVLEVIIGKMHQENIIEVRR